MALQIIERRWCDGLKLGSEPGDFIARHDPPAPGTTRTHALDGKPPRNVDLCDECNGGPTCLTLDELRAVLKEYGVSVEAGKNVERRASASAGGPAATVAKYALSGVRHGKEPTNPRKEQCLWCPMNYTVSGWISHLKKAHGFKGTKDALGSQCPACGAEGFDMVSVHIARAHDEFESTSAAFLWARDNRDPYGVYAKRRAAGQNVVEALG